MYDIIEEENLTQNNQTKEIKMNTILTKEKYMETIKTFREMFNDKELTRKKHFQTITVVRDNVEVEKKVCYLTPSLYQLKHFVFYHMLRGKNPDSTVHSTESEKYVEVMGRFRYVAKENSKQHDYFLKSIQKGFPNLSLEQIQEIIEQHFEK